MKRIHVICVTVFGLLASSVNADLISPSSKRVSQKMVVDNLADFPEYAFFACRIGAGFANLSDVVLIEGGKRYDIQRSGSSFVDVLGVPKEILKSIGGKPKAEWFQGEDRPSFPTGVVISINSIKVDETVRRDDPTAEIVAHVKFSLKPKDAPEVLKPEPGMRDLKGSGRLVMSKVMEERFDRQGKQIIPPKNKKSQSLGPFSGEAKHLAWAGLPMLALVAIGLQILRKRASFQE